MKEFRAFLLSPIPASLLGGIVSWATGGHPRPLSVAVFYVLQLYAIQLLFGVAVRAVLLKANRTSAMSFFFGGVVMTAIPSVPYLIWATGQHPESSPKAIVVLALWLLYGGLTGLFYWRISPQDAMATTTT